MNRSELDKVNQHDAFYVAKKLVGRELPELVLTSEPWHVLYTEDTTEIVRIKITDLDMDLVEPYVPPGIVCSREKWIERFFTGSTIVYRGMVDELPMEDVTDWKWAGWYRADLTQAEVTRLDSIEKAIIRVPFHFGEDIYIGYWAGSFNIKIGKSHVFESVKVSDIYDLEYTTEQLNQALHGDLFVAKSFYALKSKGIGARVDTTASEISQETLEEFLALILA